MRSLKLLVLLFLSFFLSQILISQEDVPGFNPEIYKARREKVIESIGANSIAVLKSASEKQRNGDVDYRYRQESNLLYLTGINEKSTILMLIPAGLEIDGKNVKEILFIRESNSMLEQWIGKMTGTEGAVKTYGLAKALPEKKFTEYYLKALEGKKYLYTVFQQNDSYNDLLADKKYNFNEERKKILKEKFPEIEIKPLLPILAKMREIKTKEEIVFLRKAIDATIEGYLDVLKSFKPGMFEYQAQAVIEYAFMRNGCEYTGFPCIIGSGLNSCFLHYDANKRKAMDGDVMVMDIGAEYKGYSADLTRTIPVNGVFSNEQKEIYKIVLKASDEIIKSIKPGISNGALDSIAIAVVRDGLLKIGLITTKPEARRFMPHGISHDIGLDVHDVSSYGKLKPGQVITVEPGIYIPESMTTIDKKYWNIGIRIEDDVLVTETGNEILTQKAPKTIEEIEKLMKK